MKIAMWSGPRNLSTAMMYAFGSRPDFAAWDEPFYAAYLARTGLEHPMRDAIVTAHDADPDRVARTCAGPVPDGKTHWYMKHMSLHMLEEFSLDWAESCVNVHLIRNPVRVVASYAAKRENLTLDDIGYRQQIEIHDRFPGPILDSADIRADPEGMLKRLSALIGLDWTPSMLAWPAGPKPFDGIWAAHWYGAVHQSTGFADAEGPLPELEGDAAVLANAAMPFYDSLRARALTP